MHNQSPPPRRPKPFPGRNLSANLNEATRGGVLISPQTNGPTPKHFCEHDAIVAQFASEPSRGDLLVLANQLSISDGWSFDKFERDEDHDLKRGHASIVAERTGQPMPDMPYCIYYLWGRRVISVAQDGSLYPAPGGKFIHAAKQLQDRAEQANPDPSTDPSPAP